jgi:hypothetical protein
VKRTFGGALGSGSLVALVSDALPDREEDRAKEEDREYGTYEDAELNEAIDGNIEP